MEVESWNEIDGLHDELEENHVCGPDFRHVYDLDFRHVCDLDWQDACGRDWLHGELEESLGDDAEVNRHDDELEVSGG